MRGLHLTPSSDQVHTVPSQMFGNPNLAVRRRLSVRFDGCLNVDNVGIAIINHPSVMFGIPPIYGDDWGMVYYCYTNITG